MYEIQVVCQYCGKEIARKPTDRDPMGQQSHGICAECQPYAMGEAESYIAGDTNKRAIYQRCLRWIVYMAEIRARGQQIRYAEGGI